MNNFWQDLRFGLRMLVKSPGFSLIAVVTLALGIGANTAIFSIVNGLLLQPLPYRNSERLAIIWTHSPGANVAQDWPSPGQFSALKSDNTVFEELALAQGSNVIVTGQATPERYGVVRASSAVFSLLGARAELGRGRRCAGQAVDSHPEPRPVAAALRRRSESVGAIADDQRHELQRGWRNAAGFRAGVRSDADSGRCGAGGNAVASAAQPGAYGQSG
jgi:hypothetical protein